MSAFPPWARRARAQLLADYRRFSKHYHVRLARRGRGFELRCSFKDKRWTFPINEEHQLFMEAETLLRQARLEVRRAKYALEGSKR